MPNIMERVDKIYQAKEGAKTGSVMVASGGFYRIPRKMLPALQENDTYEFQYREWEDPSGTTHRMVDTFKKVESKANGPMAATGASSRDLHIFVCGVINNALRGAGLEAIQEGDLAAAINRAIRAYNHSHLVKPYTPVEKELDDEIPYEL